MKKNTKKVHKEKSIVSTMRHAGRSITALTLAFSMTVLSLPLSSNTEAAGKVKMSKTKVTLTVGKSVKLKLNNCKKKIKWSSSNKKIVTVTQKGKVKAKKKGTANVVAKVGNKKYKCKVVVKAKAVTPADNTQKSTQTNIAANTPTNTPETTSLPVNTKIPENTLSQKMIQGTWSTTFKDGSDMTIMFDRNGGLNSKSEARNYGWYFNANPEYTGDSVTFGISLYFRKETYKLHYVDSSTLQGTKILDHEEEEITFKKLSDEDSAVYDETEFSTTSAQYIEMLQKQTYSSCDVSVQNTFNVSEKAKYQEYIDRYDLDSEFAGLTGDDLMFAIVQWYAKHYVNSEGKIGEKSDLISLDEVCKKNNIKFEGYIGGGNCYLLGTMLSQLLLAYGIPSTYVRGLPDRAVFDDCHVVVMMYSQDKKQWIMYDPSNYVYFTKADGSYASIFDFRQAIIDDEPLEIHNMDSWLLEIQPFTWKTYVDYFAKNLVFIEWYENSYAGYASSGEGGRKIVCAPDGRYPLGEHAKGDYVITTDGNAAFNAPVVIK